MEYFYKITKEQANSMGKIEYEENKIFDPFVGEQIDGTFLISEDMYLLLNKIKDFNLLELKRIDSSKLEFKKFNINNQEK